MFINHFISFNNLPNKYSQKYRLTEGLKRGIMMTYMDTSSMSVNKNQNYYTSSFVKVVIVYYVKKVSVYFIVALCQILMALNMTIKLGRTLYEYV